MNRALAFARLRGVGSASRSDGANAPAHAGRTERDARLAILLVAYLVTLLAVAWLGFLARVPVSVYHLPLSTALYLALFGTRREWRRLLCPAVLWIVVAMLFAIAFVDRSWDGLWYHKRAAIALADGWNPVYAPLDVKNLPWPDVYWKSTWVLAAVAYKVFPMIGIAAFGNGVLMAASFFAARACLSESSVSRGWSTALAVLLALNPVAVLQLTSSYVDGAVASCVTLATCAAVAYCVTQRSRFLVLATLATALALTIKVSCIAYLVALALGVVVVLRLRRRTGYARPLIAALGAALLLTLLMGYNPYVTNYVRHGNPLYPLVGPGAIDIVTPTLLRTYMGKSRAENLATSLLSKSASDDSGAQLKVPGTLSIAELEGMHSPGLKTGGFGPLFSAAIVLALAGLAAVPARSAAAAIVVGAALVAVSLVNPAPWWARYVPWLWFVPIGVLALLVVRGRGTVSRVLAGAIAFTCALNVTLCLGVSLAAAGLFTLQTWQTIAAASHWPRVAVEATDFPSVAGGTQDLSWVPRRMLFDLGIPSIEVESCDGATRARPFFKSRICEPAG